MKIAIDLDGTLWNLITPVLEQLSEHNLQYEDIVLYNLWKLLPHSEEEVYSIIENLDWKKINLYPYAYEGIIALEKKHEIYFLTKKNDAMMGWTSKVLKKNNLDHLPLIQVKNSNELFKAHPDYEYDVLIDDSPENIIACQKRGRKVIIFDAPWNRSLSGDRVNNWKEIIQMFS